MKSFKKTFIFNSHKADFAKGKVFFNYAILTGGKVIDFTEKIFFPASKNPKAPEDLINNILNNLLLILGISYWKLYCPKDIVIKPFSLSKEQADFWNIVYTKGMGEFYYKNKIDFRGLVQFPFNTKTIVKPVSFPRKNRSLVGVGGGRDSIVAAEILRKQNRDFDVFTVGTSQTQEEVALALGKKPIVIKRELDPQLFNLNEQEGTFNGHVPISAIYAFLGLMGGVFYDYNSIIVGNEKSANYGNVNYLGEEINHQWSKSEEFEKLFNEYVRKFITPDITYSSPLRNMTELKVVKEFVKYPKYFKIFSSCNTNFKIDNSHLGGAVKRHLRGGRTDSSEVLNRWCGKCAKCLFVFISLAAFLRKKEVLDIFGKNLFADESLLSLFDELIGIKNFKPFECVGTSQEVKLALGEISKKGEFNDSFLMKHFKSL